MPRICEEGGEKGLVFPAIDNEHDWPIFLRGLLYGIGLVYFFLGVAIIADMFMGSIEKVTAKRVQMWNKEAQKRRTSKLWNETVATLTLMALGSSAPEIFLSVIDIIKKRFHFGALGPSTIVGSASFNLLVIIAVCVFVIPTGERRQIANLPAFYITALFSLAAYVWMAFILTQSSPSIVEIWEAVVTALMLPILVEVSYKVDKGDANFILRKIGLLDAEEEEEEQGEGDKDGQDGCFFKFSSEYLSVPAKKESTELEVKVKRTGSSSEPATVNYHMEPLSAVPGYDYEELEGTLEFLEGETSKTISVTVLPRTPWRIGCECILILDEPEGDAGFDPGDDGGEDATVLTFMLEALDDPNGDYFWLGKMDRLVGLNMLHAGFADWADQMRNVFYCNGSPEEQADATTADWVCHLLALPWKIVFSVVPPTTFFGGWISFYSSLLGIALITACVSDMAEIFGCVLDVPDIVTAITFVALGTSMPDLFASLSAAKEDPTADASIVNVTGSNSVNVYLGLGVPWTIAAVYWKVQGRTPEWEEMYPDIAAEISGAAFVIEAKNLGFSVLTFCVVCCVALLMLHLRRKWLGGELGGPFRPKVVTSITFIGFWAGWVGIVSHRVIRWAPDRTMETMGAQGFAVFLLTVTAVSAILHMRTYRGIAEAEAKAREEEEEAAAEARRAIQKAKGGSQNNYLEIDEAGIVVPHGEPIAATV